MAQADIVQISAQLESADTKDRMLALAALREVPAEAAVPLIKKVINDRIPQVRSMAIFALGVKQTEECYPLLRDILISEADYGVRADAAGALGYLQDPRAFEPLIRAFYEDTEWLVRFSAAVSLGNLQDPRAYDALIQALNSDESVLQQAAISALGEIGAIAAVDHILRFAQSEDWLVRQRLAEALGHLPTAKSLSALKYLAKDANPQVADAAKFALSRLESEEMNR